MDKIDIEKMVYEQMYTYKYMLDNKYTFNEYVNTVAVHISKEFDNEKDKDKRIH